MDLVLNVDNGLLFLGLLLDLHQESVLLECG